MSIHNKNRLIYHRVVIILITRRAISTTRRNCEADVRGDARFVFKGRKWVPWLCDSDAIGYNLAPTTKSTVFENSTK